MNDKFKAPWLQHLEKPGFDSFRTPNEREIFREALQCPVDEGKAIQQANQKKAEEQKTPDEGEVTQD